jgi:membrane-anchored protein YejM (alkaline phosphatase superfamily)
VEDPEIATRISQYEMAFRMQAAVPELIDIKDEPQHVLDLYGCEPGDGSFASNCLLARRLAERGVRFIQLYHRDWDHHNDLVRYIQGNAKNVDRATAALITDLKQRGLLEDTLIVWGGEFGRTPMSQTNKGGPGRDHHMNAFSMFLTGGGIRRGITYGATDELGYHVVENPVHVHDLHATLLQQLGIQHNRLSVRSQGLDVRLTGVEGPRVVTDILA